MSVPFKTTMPKFDFAMGTPTAALPSQSRGNELDEWPQFIPQAKVAVLVEDRVRLFPRQDATLRVPTEVARPLLATERTDGSAPGYVIVIPTKDSRSGVLASVGGRLESQSGESVELTFGGLATVGLKSVTQVGPRRLAEVEHLLRPKGALPDKELAELKAAFLAFSKRDATYRKQIPFPDFEAQSFLEMDSLEGMSHFLLNHVPVPAATQWELLTLSNADRLRRLRPLLDGPGAPAAP